MSNTRSLLFSLTVLGILTAAVACGGGTGSQPGSSTLLPPPARPGGVAQGIATAFPLEQTNTPLPLPGVDGISTTLTLSANDARIGGRLTVSVADQLPPFVLPLKSGQQILESFTFIPSEDVTFNNRPLLTITLPQNAPNQGAYFAWSFEQGSGWTTYSGVLVHGSVLQIGGAPQASFMRKGLPFVITLLTAAPQAACPTPTPRATATPVPSPLTSPRAISAAYVENVTGFTPSVNYFVSVFTNGNYDVPAENLPLPTISIIHAAPNGTLLALPQDGCNILAFARGSTTPTTITVPGCAEDFVLDSGGNLYAIVNSGNSIVELPANDYGTVLRTLTPEPGFIFRMFPSLDRGSALTTDTSNNFFAVEYANAQVLDAKVEQYAPSGTQPLRILPVDNYPTQVLVDSTGEIYVGSNAFTLVTLGYSRSSALPGVVIPEGGGYISLDSSDHLYVSWFGVPEIIDEFAPRSDVSIARATLIAAGAGPIAVDPADNVWAAAHQFPILIYPSLNQTPTPALDGATPIDGLFDIRIAQFAFVK